MNKVNSIQVTTFPNRFAQSMKAVTLTRKDLSNPVLKKKKSDLALLKLGHHSGEKTAANCVRFDASVTDLTGIEIDYDGGEMAFATMVMLLDLAGITCWAYTSPSHTEENPMWRILLPFSEPFTGTQQEMYSFRLAGVYLVQHVLSLVFGAENKALSQSFYFGAIGGSDYQHAFIDGECIDVWSDREIDAYTLITDDEDHDKLIPEVAVEGILSGDDFHSASVRLAARYARKGMGFDEIKAILIGLFDQSEEVGSDRWQQRTGKELDRAIKSGIAKYYVEPVELKMAMPIQDLVTLPPLPPTPHMLNVITDYAERTARQPQPELNLFGAIAAASAIMHDYRTDEGNHPVLYILNVAGTASGKDRAKSLVHELMTAADQPKLIRGSGFSSASGCISMYVQSPTGVMVIDEFGKELEAMANDNMKGTAMKTMMEAWSSPNTTLSAPQMSTLGRPNPMSGVIVQNPRVSILGLTTPTNYIDAVTDADIASGQLNRFLVCKSDRPRTASRLAGIPEVPTGIIEWMKAIIGRGIALIFEDDDGDNDFITLTFSDDARESLQNLEDNILLGDGGLYAKLELKGIEHLISRTREKAMRLALIGQLCEDPDSEVIEGWVMDWAIGLVLRCDLDMCSMFYDNRVGDTKYAKMRARVEAYIAPGKALNRKALNGGFTLGELYQASTKGDAFDAETPERRREIVKGMVEEGRLVKNETANPVGKPTIKYSLPQ